MDDPIGRQLLLQVILIAVNAFFAAAEIAVVSLNANKLRKMAEEGDKHAARMLELVGNPTGFLSAIQIGITLAGFWAALLQQTTLQTVWFVGLSMICTIRPFRNPC